VENARKLWLTASHINFFEGMNTGCLDSASTPRRKRERAKPTFNWGKADGCAQCSRTDTAMMEGLQAEGEERPFQTRNA